MFALVLTVANFWGSASKRVVVAVAVAALSIERNCSINKSGKRSAALSLDCRARIS